MGLAHKLYLNFKKIKLNDSDWFAFSIENTYEIHNAVLDNQVGRYNEKRH
jgi:hypothetical protein